MHPNDLPAARAFAEARGMLPEIQTVLKSAVAPGSIASSELAPIAQFEQMAQAYLATLRNASAFDALLPFMRNVPFRIEGDDFHNWRRRLHCCRRRAEANFELDAFQRRA